MPICIDFYTGKTGDGSLSQVRQGTVPCLTVGFPLTAGFACNCKGFFATVSEANNCEGANN